MTYCLGILLPEGLVLASDSRSNAGVDQVALVKKLALFEVPGEPPRLFHIYSAGNFVEASDRSRFLQLGETKYGKPILDRALNDATSLDEAAKLSLLSFDATMRSNLSVDAPIDLLRYRADSFSARNFATLEKDDSYWMALRKHYAEGLSSLVASIPPPPNLA